MKTPDPNCQYCHGKGVWQRTDLLEPWVCECCEEKPVIPQPEQKSETPRTDKAKKEITVESSTLFPPHSKTYRTLQYVEVQVTEKIERELTAARSEVESVKAISSELFDMLESLIPIGNNNAKCLEVSRKLASMTAGRELLTERDTLRKELEEAKQTLAAIQVGINNEFKTRPTESGDIIQDFGYFIEHHNSLESQLTALTAEVESMKGRRS